MRTAATSGYLTSAAPNRQTGAPRPPTSGGKCAVTTVGWRWAVTCWSGDVALRTWGSVAWQHVFLREFLDSIDCLPGDIFPTVDYKKDHHWSNTFALKKKMIGNVFRIWKFPCNPTSPEATTITNLMHILPYSLSFLFVCKYTYICFYKNMEAKSRGFGIRPDCVAYCIIVPQFPYQWSEAETEPTL